MIPIDSPTLRYGLGCFETIKVYPSGKIAFLSAHVERLQRGAEVCGLSCPTKSEIMQRAQQFVLERLPLAGTQVMRLILTEECGVSFFMEPYFEKFEGLTLAVSSVWRIDSGSPLNAFKSFNYLKNHLAFQEAISKGFNDSLLLNERAEIVETSRANIFLKHPQKGWLTPPTASGCLPGIVRKLLIKYLKADEKAIHIGELSQFQEVILSNSLIEVKTVSKINSHNFQAADLEGPLDYIRNQS